MVNRLVSGGGAGRLLDEVGEGSGLGDHRPDSSREASRVSAEWAPEILAAQAEWRTWLLRGAPARCLLRGWRPPRGGGGAAAVTLALGLVPGP
jgi:hypothetical protein